MKKLLFAVGALALLGVAALAQVPGLFIASPTGLEQINVLVPSSNGIVTNPQIQTVTINQIRNAEGYTLIAAGTTVTTQAPNTSAALLAIGAITTWNVNMPLAPTDGQLMKLSCPGGAVGTVSLAATLPTGVTIVGASYASCSSTSPTDAAYLYNASGNIWYRTE